MSTPYRGELNQVNLDALLDEELAKTPEQREQEGKTMWLNNLAQKQLYDEQNRAELIRLFGRDK